MSHLPTSGSLAPLAQSDLSDPALCTIIQQRLAVTNTVFDKESGLLFHRICSIDPPNIPHGCVPLVQALMQNENRMLFTYPTRANVFRCIGNIDPETPLGKTLIQFVKPIQDPHSSEEDDDDDDDLAINYGYNDYLARVVICAAISHANYSLACAIAKSYPKADLFENLASYFRLYNSLQKQAKKKNAPPLPPFTSQDIDQLICQFTKRRRSSIRYALEHAPNEDIMIGLLKVHPHALHALSYNDHYDSLSNEKKKKILFHLACMKTAPIHATLSNQTILDSVSNNKNVYLTYKHAGRIITRAAERAWLDPDYKWAQYRLRKGMSEFSNEVPLTFREYVETH